MRPSETRVSSIVAEKTCREEFAIQKAIQLCPDNQFHSENCNFLTKNRRY